MKSRPWEIRIGQWNMKILRVATEQVLMAQVALQKYENGQGSLYDFTDYKGPSQSGNYAVPVMAATLTIAAGAGVWMIFRKRGKTHA